MILRQFFLSEWQASEDEAEAAARQRAQAAAEAVQAVAQAQVSQDDCIPFIGVIASSTAESSSLQCDKLKTRLWFDRSVLQSCSSILAKVRSSKIFFSKARVDGYAK